MLSKVLGVGSVLPRLLETKTFGLTPDQAGDLGRYAILGMLVGALTADTVVDRVGRKKLLVACVTLFSPASGICAVSGSIAVFGLGRTLAGVGLGGLLPIAISMVCDYAPRGRGALAIGRLMTAHHAGGILNSAPTMIYATVSIRSTPDNRATAVGWTSGMGRFGAVFGPWLGGQLLAAGNGDFGFTAFALAGLSSMVFIGIAALRSRKSGTPSSTGQELVTAH